MSQCRVVEVPPVAAAERVHDCRRFVQVPDVRGWDLWEAQNILQGAGLNGQVDGLLGQVDGLLGTVERQSPTSGDRVERGSHTALGVVFVTPSGDSGTLCRTRRAAWSVFDLPIRSRME